MCNCTVFQHSECKLHYITCTCTCCQVGYSLCLSYLATIDSRTTCSFVYVPVCTFDSCDFFPLHCTCTSHFQLLREKINKFRNNGNHSNNDSDFLTLTGNNSHNKIACMYTQATLYMDNLELYSSVQAVFLNYIEKTGKSTRKSKLMCSHI